jgi:hypothetical protein
MAVVPTTRIYEGTRIPERCPTILDVDPAEHDLEDILTVNFGRTTRRRTASSA